VSTNNSVNDRRMAVPGFEFCSSSAATSCWRTAASAGRPVAAAIMAGSTSNEVDSPALVVSRRRPSSDHRAASRVRPQARASIANTATASV
jgi:hypothetical protein